MFWWSYFHVKSYLSLFVVRHISFLIWCVSQSFFFIQACPISLLSISLLLTNIFLNLALLSYLSFILKTCYLTLRFCSSHFYYSILFTWAFFQIFFSLCHHRFVNFSFPVVLCHTPAFSSLRILCGTLQGSGGQFILPVTQQRFADRAETMLK